MNKLRFLPVLLSFMLMQLITACSTGKPPGSPTPSLTDPILQVDGPYSLISQDSLFTYLEDLTAIQAYSGWRNSASQGEAEALDFVEKQLAGMSFLSDLGLELEQQDFNVFLATDLWETRLIIQADGEQVEVPADGLRGPRDNIEHALRFDSDGELNDSEPNPIEVEGSTLFIKTADQIEVLEQTELDGIVVFLNYAVIDRSILGMPQATAIAEKLLEKQPSALILVTSFSNKVGESHGTFVGDLSALNLVEAPLPPTLYVRLEDLSPAGILSLDDLAEVDKVRLIWDADVFSPASSSNLKARIPGKDSSNAMILGAHIDSPNGPGAMDDGSGSVILLEIARILDEARIQPDVDLYLVWFGSEEIGLYGSSHFAATHQDLLDQTVAMLEIDCLTRPLDNLNADLNIVGWSFQRLGDPSLKWPEHLFRTAAVYGVETIPRDFPYLYSDNGSFTSYDVPNADLIYENEEEMEAVGGVHYAGHIHDPYDTVELAREVGDVLENMTVVALSAVLEITTDRSDFRVSPTPDRRILFIASHTESAHMGPTAFFDLGMTLAMEGFDVDLLPYGQPVTPSELQDAEIVVILPVHDYPTSQGNPELYDEAWSVGEIEAIEEYVSKGGFLVLTNSANRLKYANSVMDPNEDNADINDLAELFGISFQEGALYGNQVQVEGESPLLKNVSTLEVVSGNGVPFVISTGQVLGRIEGKPAVALLDYGSAGGQVLVLADVGLLGANWMEPTNLPFWQNIARFDGAR